MLNNKLSPQDMENKHLCVSCLGVFGIGSDNDWQNRNQMGFKRKHFYGHVPHIEQI